MSTDKIKELVREKYGKAALQSGSGSQACCGVSSCCETDVDPITAGLYDASQTQGLPEAALLASLGCGNTTALAQLSLGETVLDLGCGGGIGVLLSAKHVGPAGSAYGLFAGKAGVGKTSLACAAAIELARSGRRVLLVSTGPASNLDEVLQTKIGASQSPVQIPDLPNLRALNIDPEAAARIYRERVIAPYRELLPEAAVASIEEQLSGACTVEIAAFNEFTKLVAGQDTTANFDNVIFDTAPPRHTLRLLKLPAAWAGFIATNTTGTSCLGPLAGRETQKSFYDASLRALTNPAVTTLVLVQPPRSSLARRGGPLARGTCRYGRRESGPAAQWSVQSTGCGRSRGPRAGGARHERVSCDALRSGGTDPGRNSVAVLRSHGCGESDRHFHQPFRVTPKASPGRRDRSAIAVGAERLRRLAVEITQVPSLEPAQR